MKFHFQQALKALMLLAFSAMIASLHWTGELTKFINPKYESLSKTAAILFFVLFLVQLTRVISFSKSPHHCDHAGQACCSHHHHGYSWIAYLIIMTPILTGFFVPAKILDAAIADKKGGAFILTQQSQSSKIEDYLTSNETIDENIYDEHEADTRLLEEKQEMTKQQYERLKQQLSQKPILKMTDKDYTIYYEEINQNLVNYLGKKIQLKGFVLKEESFTEKQLVISRFLITHCVADASIVGFLTEFPEAPSLTEDTWIEVVGTISQTTYEGTSLPVIHIEDWVTIEQPESPYLYPINIRMSF
ncbi:TIGR03943 family protein [Lysinibacillus irui]|uniref:TIGR03943 family protein n=1 Tax=Lysinibacillus irui TaxID=2998077 RepID=A0ABU5NPL2_9BACI|nr:TIGR03943 family protein [Lysinibacillus irui]MEA0552075.1 TIGR03943 family protein [Lysinibacillus irui]MEA0978000.1 TIGR03943 family protein [Lysinibacillus irui]MEA1044154.1 TIGR03943 family protein [Lysinibacillus irui]